MVIIGIVTIIGITIILQNPNNAPPEIKDQPTISESTEIRTITNVGDRQEISDSANIQVENEIEFFINENEIEFFINENGNRTFIIEASDSPKIEDG